MLALFLGGWGVHDFYAGYTGKGVCHILFTMLISVLFVVAVLPLIFGGEEEMGVFLVLFFLALILNFANFIWIIIEALAVKEDADGNAFS